MKQADGGFAPSYNVQISTDAAKGIIVAVDVTQAGNDCDQLVNGIERVGSQYRKNAGAGSGGWWLHDEKRQHRSDGRARD